jgi:predicted dinucleotide-binding enzyme
MNYSIIGTGLVGSTFASLFEKAGIEVSLANSRGADSVEPVAKQIGPHIIAKSLADALKADIIFAAVPFLKFKDLGTALPDWSGKIVIDVTNAFKLPPEVLEAELQGRLSSEVNAGRVPGAKLVKSFNHLPMAMLAAPAPAGSRRVIFVSSDHADASEKVADMAEKLGFAPIELGKIAEGGRLIQPGNPLLVQNLVKLDEK